MYGTLQTPGVAEWGHALLLAVFSLTSLVAFSLLV